MMLANLRILDISILLALTDRPIFVVQSLNHELTLLHVEYSASP
jgi:hypothetical protein